MSEEDDFRVSRAANRRYPIARLIQDTMAAKWLSRRDVAFGMGYINLNRAYEVLYACLRQGRNDGPLVRQRLATGLDIPFAEVDKACEETDVIRKADKRAARLEGADERRVASEARRIEEDRRARAEFKPHLWIVPERSTPSPIFIAAFCGVDPFLRVGLPDGTVKLPFEEQKAVVWEHIQSRRLRMNGTAGPFGGIRGYQYRFTYDDYWRVSVEGEFGELVKGRPCVGRASVTVGGKTIEAGTEGLLAKLDRQATEKVSDK